ETPARPEARPAAAPPAGSSIEARVNRFITGTAAPDLSGAVPAAQRKEPEVPARPAEPRPERTEVARTEVARTDAAYASELPDLSGPKPPQPRKAGAEAANRPAVPASPRVQVANRSGGPVRATMQIRHIDPWSALKVSLLLSVALFFVWMIAVAFLYLVLGGMGVWSKLNSNVGDLLTSTSGGGELVSSGTIFGGAALIGLVNIVLLTAMATIGTFIYNLSTDIVGGIEVTLADRD
ncbi:MAG TPA: DUF3566 domain-containing protein, partial [Mycobacterium sp.]|nr:DUF3566 domain-containing protein [Mycobacterium sp.]